MKRRRRSSSLYPSGQVGGLGLQSLTELAHRNRSPLARWWRGHSHLARAGYRILFTLGGSFVILIALMMLGGVLMP